MNGGSRAGVLARPSGDWLFALARFRLLTHPSGRVINGSRGSTRAERANALQPAIALGFCEAVGRPTRDALFHGSQQIGTAQTGCRDCLSWQPPP